MKIIAVLMMSALLVGCAKQAKESVTVFAAAGTAPAMKEIAARFEEETGARVVFNFANAGVLAKQLAGGAAADLFFSANEKWMNFAADTGVILMETRADLLSNRLVVIVPAGKTAPVDLTRPRAGKFAGRLAVGDPVTPVGIYAEQALTKLGWWKCERCTGDTVQKVLHYVALNEADAGVVFRSVAVCAAAQVDVVGMIPAELHKPIRFPVAACVGVSDTGRAFLAFLKSETAAAVFDKFGWDVCEKEHDHV